MDSIWINSTERPQFDALLKNIQTDVLIIGGGLAGILCAYLLDGTRPITGCLDGNVAKR